MIGVLSAIGADPIAAYGRYKTRCLCQTWEDYSELDSGKLQQSRLCRLQLDLASRSKFWLSLGHGPLTLDVST